MNGNVVTVGFAWRLHHEPGTSAQGSLPGQLVVDWTYVTSQPDGQGGWIRRPVRWKFLVPQCNPDSAIERFGASEVRGLFGGVPSVRLARLSEEAERVIGDAVTYGLFEALDRERKKQQNAPQTVQFVILGAALPKVVGRLASLRLDPKLVAVAWISPVPMPRWISERADEFLLIPPQHWRPDEEEGWENWEEECIVRGWRHRRNQKTLVVQQLALWDRTSLNLESLHWAEAKFAQSMLPREVIAAAGQVENLAQGRYADSPGQREENFLPPPEGFVGQPYTVPTNQCSEPPFGWEIKWNSSSEGNPPQAER